MAEAKVVKNVLQYIFFFGLAVFLLWLAGRGMPLKTLMLEIQKANSSPLLGIVFFGIASHFFRALRWKLLIQSMNYTIKTSTTIMAVMVGYLINLATPRMGEVARCGIIAKYEGVPADKVAGTMVVERIIDFICLLSLIFSTYIVEYERVNVYFIEKISAIKTNTNPVVFTSIICVLLAIIIGSIIYVRKMKNADNKASHILKNIGEGIMSVGKLKKKTLFILYTFLIWISYLMMVYIGFGALDELKNLDIKAALSLLSFGSIGIIATPGGTGAYHFIIKEILSKLYNITPTIALTFGYLSWGVQNAILLIGGVISLIALPILNKKNAH
jgi:uncharacterized protein (TIRG00374 family)